MDASTINTLTSGADFTTALVAKKSHQLRLPNGSVASELFDNPWKFNFFEAVLLLQQIAADGEGNASEPIGQFARPSLEALRFTVPHTMAFPSSTIDAIQWDSADQRPNVSVNFMGLTGPSGVLPRSYTERLDRIEAMARHSERHALRDWLDNFNHRMISLFFDAWAKYRFPVAIRQQMMESQNRSQSPTLIRIALSAIAGLESPQATIADRQRSGEAETLDRPAVDRDELLGIAGVLAQRPMNATNLQSTAEQCLGVPVTVKQFDGCWLNLEEDSQTRLGSSNCTLGENAMLGNRIWNRQQKIRLEVGPLSKRDFDRFLPPTKHREADGYRRLSELVRICIGSTLEFDIQPILRVEESLEVKLSCDGNATQLGINSWLGTPEEETVDDAVFAGA